jgi:hypothetical protein
MMQAPAIYSQCVPDTPQQASYIHQILQQVSYTQQEPHQTTYMPPIPILPQQPNYIIHTSQAATTSRAPTQTADFSGEESPNSDDNDDRLSWQAVSGRGKKRTGPRTTKVPTMEKNKPQETDKHPSKITVTNKYRVQSGNQKPTSLGTAGIGEKKY